MVCKLTGSFPREQEEGEEAERKERGSEAMLVQKPHHLSTHNGLLGRGAQRCQSCSRGKSPGPESMLMSPSWVRKGFRSPYILPTPVYGVMCGLVWACCTATTAAKLRRALSTLSGCFPDTVHVELCLLFVKNVKSYRKTEPSQLLWSLPLWAAIYLSSPEASLARRAQSPPYPMACRKRAST